MVYLIHLDAPLGDPDNPRGRAQHYLGYAADVNARIAAHRCGAGARLLAVANSRGIRWELVRTWDGDRELERRLKRQKNAPRMCPICQHKG